MDPKYQALFTPWKIGNVEIKNRIVMCPMGGTSLFGWMEHTGNHFDKEAAAFFLEKAKNNVGLIIPGIAPIKSTLPRVARERSGTITAAIFCAAGITPQEVAMR